MSESQQELKGILRALLAEIQHLQVEQAVLIARQAPNATAHDLLEAKKAAQLSVAMKFVALAGKIEALA